MTVIRLSVITPGWRWRTLDRMLKTLIPQLGPEDENLIVADGDKPECRRVVDAYQDLRLRYWETPPIHNWGNPQRNEAITKAKGTHLMFVDDDDEVNPGAIDTIRKILSENPDRPHMFSMYHRGNLLWRSPDCLYGNVSGQMFFPPNVPERLGKWSDQYGADFDFIRSTMTLYPGGYDNLIWRREVPTVQGLNAGGDPLA